jgi:hypothetical protein
MPFNSQLSINNLFEVQLWALKEPPEVLFQIAREAGADLSGFTDSWSDRRKCEWLAVRKLLMQWGISNLQYQIDGKPFVPGQSLEYAVSHSTHFAAVGRSNSRFFGIDVERIDPRSLRILPRFASDTEAAFFGRSAAYATWLWAVKEAVFKAVPFSGIDFKSMIRVTLPVNDINAPLHYAVFEGYGVHIHFKLRVYPLEQHFLVCANAD